MYDLYEADEFGKDGYCIVDETVLCCECGNCPPIDEEDLYPFSNEEE